MARARMQHVIKEKNIHSADLMVKHAKSNYNKLLSLDPTWKLEAGLIAGLCGDKAEERMSSKILALFPTEERAVNIPDTILQVEAIMNAADFKMTPLGVQSQVKLVLGFLKTLDACGHPDLKSQNRSQMLRTSYQRAAFFLRVADGEDKILAGSKALSKIIQGAREKHKKKELKFEDMKEVDRYGWLVAPDDKDAVAMMKKYLDENQVADVEKAAMKPRPKASSSSSAKQKVRTDRATEKAWEMFS